MLNIQTLFYKIGATNLEFKQKVIESKGKLQEFDDRTKDNIRTLRNWGAVAGATATAVLYALNRTVQSTNQTASDIAKLSEQTGVAAEKMQALGYAAKQNNSSMEVLGSSLVRMTRRLEAANQGNETYAGSYRRMGVQIHDTNGKLRATEDIFLDLADAFAASNDENLKTQVAFDVLGQSGYDLIPLLNQGRQEIIRLAEEANRLGIVLSRENIAKFAQYDQVLVKWREGMNGIKMQVATAVVPVFSLLTEKAGDALEKFMDWARENPQIVSRSIVLGGALLALGLALGGVALGITIVSIGINFLKTTFGILTNPIFLLILLMGLLYTAWKQDWGGIQALVTSAVNAIKLKWDELVKWWDKSVIGKALNEWWAEVKRIWDEESELTFGEKVIETLGLIPGLKWVPEFVKKLEEIWDNEDPDITLADKTVATLKLIIETLKANVKRVVFDFLEDDEAIRTTARILLDAIFAVGLPLAVAISYIKFLGIAKTAVMTALQNAWTAAQIGTATFAQGLLTLAVPLGTLALVGALIWFSLDDETKKSIKDEIDKLKSEVSRIWGEKKLTLPVEIALALSSASYEILKKIDDYFDIRTPEEKQADIDKRQQMADELPPGGRIGAWFRRITNNPHEKDVYFYPEQALPEPDHAAKGMPDKVKLPNGGHLDNINRLKGFLDSGGMEAIDYIAQELGVEPAWVLGQMSHETGYFGSALSNSHNYAGVKRFGEGDYVMDGGMKYRSFDTAMDFAKDFVDMIRDAFSKAEGAGSLQDYLYALQHEGKYGIYAEDQAYESKVPGVVANIEKYLAFLELEEMMRDYGYDSMEYFVAGVADGSVKLKQKASARFFELMGQFVFDDPTNDVMAHRWGYDVVAYFIEGVKDAVAEMGPESEAEFMKLMKRWIHDKPENDEEAMTWGLDVVKWLIEGVKAGVYGTVDIAKELFAFLGDSMMESLRAQFPEQMAEIEALLGDAFGAVELAFGEGGMFDPEAMKLKQLNETTKQWTDNLTQGLSSAIGYGRGLKDTFEGVINVFDNFLGMLASQFLQTQVFAPLFSKIGFGDFLAGLPIFHEGGMILNPAAYYHSGGFIGELKSDEVPIIAQTGERVLSRSQNDQFENLLQNVSTDGTGAQQIEVNINAVDAASFQELLMRNPDVIKHLFIDDLGKNGPLRKILLQLARG